MSYVWWDIHSSMVLTPLWSVGNYLCFFLMISMYKHCFLPLLCAFVMKFCFLKHCSLSHNPYCCSLPSPMCMVHRLICAYLNSSVFIHCLLTIICVMLMSIVYLIQHLHFCILFLFLYYIFWACHSRWLNWSHEYVFRYVIFGPTFFVIFHNLLLVTLVTFACIYC